MIMYMYVTNELETSERNFNNSVSTRGASQIALASGVKHLILPGVPKEPNPSSIASFASRKDVTLNPTLSKDYTKDCLLCTFNRWTEAVVK